MLNGGEGEYDFYSTMDANGGTLELLSGSSLIFPDSFVLINVDGIINTSHELGCSITTSVDMLEGQRALMSQFVAETSWDQIWIPQKWR